LAASVGGPQQLGGPGQWPVWPVVNTALAWDEGRIYTSVAHAQYSWTTYIYASGGGCVKQYRLV